MILIPVMMSRVHQVFLGALTIATTPKWSAFLTRPATIGRPPPNSGFPARPSRINFIKLLREEHVIAEKELHKEI